MGRALVNRVRSPRQTQENFSDLQTEMTLGPNPEQDTVNGESILTPQNDVVTVNDWVAMTQADQGLLDAIYDFVNTTKEGVSVSPDVVRGRTKKLFFNFYGTMGKSVMPGEIGQFEVNFSYTPRAVSDTGVPSAE